MDLLNCKHCHTEIEVADQTLYLIQSQYTDAWPTGPSADPIAPEVWQGTVGNAEEEEEQQQHTGKYTTSVRMQKKKKKNTQATSQHTHICRRRRTHRQIHNE